MHSPGRVGSDGISARVPELGQQKVSTRGFYAAGIGRGRGRARYGERVEVLGGTDGQTGPGWGRSDRDRGRG